MRVVEQRILRRSRQDLRMATACSTRARIFAWERLTAFWPVERVSSVPGTEPGPCPRRLDELCPPSSDAGFRESGDDGVLTCGPDVVDGTGQSRRGPRQSTGRIGQDLHVHPVLPALAEEARCAAIRSIGSRVPSGHGRLRRCRPDRFHEEWGGSGQELHGLGGVPAGGGGPDAEPGRELGIRVAVAKVGEGEQGLPARAQAPPAGTEVPAVFAELGGQEARGRAGHVDAGRVDKHTKPLVGTDFLVENPSTRGFTCPSAQLADRPGRLERAQSFMV
ncbi:hypothetical protein SGRIM128S_03486 [Streptomyces griseomycini]